MTDEGIIVLGIPIPSSSPVFLTIVAVHVIAGIVCTLAGVAAMLAPKRSGRHPYAGTVYFLEPSGSFPFHGRSISSPLAGQQSPLHFGRRIFWRRHSWTNCEASALAWVVDHSRDRHGAFVRRPAYSVLCRQRAAPSHLALIAAFGTLAPSQHRWPSGADMGINTSSAHSASAHVIKKWHLTSAYCGRYGGSGSLRPAGIHVLSS
jgi:hypothetical protein